MDFGLARAATESRLTKSGTLVGTLAYLSPEQVVASKEVDGRSDIYSLGTVLYECLVGEPPFSGEMQSILYRIVHEIPQPPRSLGASIDEELERIVLSSIAKDPKERPQTAGQLAESLRRYRATLRESDRSRSVAGLTRTFQPQRPAVSPFVGRSKELAELQHRLNAALGGECQLVVVGGEPGIGKTRLIDELEALAGARKIRVLHGRSVEQDRAFPYQGFCELIQEYFRFKETDSSPPPDLSDLASDLVSLFPMLNEVSDIRSAATTSSGIARPIRLKASVHPLLRDRYGSLLTALFSVWADLGVEVSIATPDMAAYLDSWQNNEGLDLTIGRWNADYDDPDNFTFTLFDSSSGALRSYFCSNESDEILEEARSEGRPSVRETLYRKFESLLSELGTLLPLFHDIDYRLAGPKVRGLELRGTAPYVNYAEIGVAESDEARIELQREAGGVVQVPVAGVVQSMDPARADTVEQGEVVPSVYETLTRDAGGARFVPWLASDIRVESSGLKYRFRLRDDVRFHDGRKLSARDVRYSFERLLQSASENRWLYSCIKGARQILNGEAGDLAGLKIHSATELTIELDEPVGFFLALVAYPGAAIVPEGSDPAGEASVGTGPFRITQFEPGRRLELQRNKAYWRKGSPRSEGVVFTFGVSPKEILSGFRSGRFSLASDLLPEDAESLRHEPDFASGYRETPRLITYFAILNAHRGPLSDPRLRHFIVDAIDAPRLVRQTAGRIAIPASGLIPPGLLGHESVRVAAGQSLMALKASKASNAAPGRLPSPIELTVALHPLFFEQYAGTYNEISRVWAELGFKTRVVNRTMAEYLDAMAHGSTDVIIGRWSADYPDADTFIYILHSKGGGYGRFTASPELDRLAERGRAEAAPAVRHSLYREAEEILVRDALLIPLFHEQAYRFARPEVEGLTVSFATPTVAYESLRIRG
jgi:ABC-type oligopeptide transport system substrate-binding subunit